MPRIIVVSDMAVGASRVLFSERVEATNLASEHFRLQLAERLGWAVGDAHRLEAAQPPGVAP
ncbi:MAG: hypothetical protein M3065_06770 [Actinomycetota bacterium]|nr:hypothetical protein [Actinomycetota bacterium]